jgi:hypothetical protein
MEMTIVVQAFDITLAAVDREHPPEATRSMPSGWEYAKSIRH